MLLCTTVILYLPVCLSALSPPLAYKLREGSVSVSGYSLLWPAPGTVLCEGNATQRARSELHADFRRPLRGITLPRLTTPISSSQALSTQRAWLPALWFWQPEKSQRGCWSDPVVASVPLHPQVSVIPAASGSQGLLNFVSNKAGEGSFFRVLPWGPGYSCLTDRNVGQRFPGSPLGCRSCKPKQHQSSGIFINQVSR